MEFAEKTLDSKLIFDGRVVKLYKDSVELPTGQTSFREVIKHSGGVVILAYKEDKILRLPIVKIRNGSLEVEV